MADNSLPKTPERDLDLVTYEQVKEIRVVDTSDNSKTLAINNLTIAGTKVTVAVDGLSGTVDGAFGDVLTAIAEKADTTQVEALDAEKVDKTQSVLAGAGMTGGGALSGDVTLNVVTADDSLVVAADNIKVNTVDDLTSDSATRPLSAKQGKALNVAKVGLAGNETIAGVKTFSSSPEVPTPTTDYQAAPKTYVDTQDGVINTDIARMVPSIALVKRALADSATQIDKDNLLSVYAQYLDQLPSTAFLHMPHCASKIRTSGLNRYGAKIYDLNGTVDAAQATEGTQPFMTVNAAPESKVGVKFVTGQTQTGLLDFTDKAYLSTDSWTFTLVAKVNKRGGARIYFGSGYLAIEASTIVLHNGSAAVLTGTATLDYGRTHVLEFQYSNGAGLIKVNGLPIATTPLLLAMTFGQISYNSTYPFDGVVYWSHAFNARMSEAQSAANYTVLNAAFPSVESVVIGNQVWSTSNFEGTVAGDGTDIPEVQGGTTDGNVELITNAADREFSSDTGWWTRQIGITIADGVVHFVATPQYNRLYRNPVLTIGKFYRVTYTILNYVSGTLRVYTGVNSVDRTANGTYTEYMYAAIAELRFSQWSVSGGTFDIDNVSIKEVGASDSTNVYNYVYAATSGSASVKDLAATKAAATWCHYDNSAVNGAVYGKHFNGYSVKLLDKYPLRGYRIPSYASVVQLVTLCGSPTIAAKKLKATGVTYWASGNTGTNEAGFSAIASGVRGVDGTFADAGNKFVMWTSDGYLVTFDYNADTVTYTSGADPIIGASIRLLRNEPAGANELSYTSGLFTTDITSAAKQIPISFGRMVDAIRIKSENALTAIEAKMHNAAGTAVATLITGKTMNAGETKMFTVSADWVSLLQDGTVRVTASGNSGAAVGMEIEILTHKGVLS